MAKMAHPAAVVCAGRSVPWDRIARMVPETVLLAEPSLSRALHRCFLGDVNRLVVDLAECDEVGLSALAHLHRDRPGQKILLLDSGTGMGLLRDSSLADLPVAVLQPSPGDYGVGLSGRYSRMTGPTGDSEAT